MKKILSLFLILITLLSLASCGNSTLLSKSAINADKMYIEYKITNKQQGYTGENVYKMGVYDEKIYTNSFAGGYEDDILIEKDCKYSINHEFKTIQKLPGGTDMATTDIFNLKYLGELTSTGEDGEYEYEIYQNEDFRQKFYFKDNEIAKYEMFDGETTTYIEVLKLTKDVDKSLFELPKDYKQINYEDIGK